jgi:hypothetical protein
VIVAKDVDILLVELERVVKAAVALRSLEKTTSYGAIGPVFAGGPRSAALKRASLDLPRVLAQLRKGDRK